MPDIIERLRRRAQGKQLGDDPLAKVFGDAADEIERLRREIEHLREIIHAGADEIEQLRALSMNNAHAWDALVRELDKASDEIVRLRAAPLPDAVVAALNEARGFCIETPCLGAAHVIDLIDAALGEAKHE